MTAPTKVPSAHAPAGGPVPVPRVVGNRRIRTGGIALAVMLLAFGAALSGIALLSASRTASYLEVRQAVPIGAEITAADLTTVSLRAGTGLDPIPASRIRSVIGLHAATALVPGSLLIPGQLTNKSLVTDDQAQIGIAVRGSGQPAVALHPGDRIVLVPLGGGGGTAATPVTYTATVIDAGTAGSDGGTVVHIAVPATLAPTLVRLNASGGFGLILASGS